MNLSSLFSRAKEKDLSTQVNESCERVKAEILGVIHSGDTKDHSWPITCTRIKGARTSEGEIMVEASETLRLSAAYEELHNICSNPVHNCHIQFGCVRNIYGDIVTYIAIDPTRPYSAPELPVGPTAAPSTILHGQCTDDDHRICYDNEGFAYLDHTSDEQTTAGAVEEIAVEIPAIGHITAPKVTFKRATA